MRLEKKPRSIAFILNEIRELKQARVWLEEPAGSLARTKV